MTSLSTAYPFMCPHWHCMGAYGHCFCSLKLFPETIMANRLSAIYVLWAAYVVPIRVFEAMYSAPVTSVCLSTPSSCVACTRHCFSGPDTNELLGIMSLSFSLCVCQRQDTFVLLISGWISDLLTPGILPISILFPAVNLKWGWQLQNFFWL